MTMKTMKLPTHTILATAILLAPAFVSVLAYAQVPGQTYQQGVQSYNSQDPQNYGAPASQAYSQDPQNQQQPAAHAPSPDQYVPPQGFGQQQDQPAAGPNGPASTVNQAPPAIPDYDQPEAPGDGYIWTPGYWAWTGFQYQWVPGAWVDAPYDGALWTPGYWGYYNGGYFWNAGYWGPTVGYYGGIDYGFGYFGVGFYGGYWYGNHFFYNRYYSHVGLNNRYLYNQRFTGVGNVHPGGHSFTASAPVRTGAIGGVANRAGGFSAYRGSTVPHPAGQGFSGGYNNMPRTSYGSASAARSYSAPSNGGYHPSAPAGGSYHPSAPAGGGYHPSAPSGGGAHPSVGGGGHAGGGGRR